ncbi:hypothetical protein Klosneuvirus_6_43 [Klosneuvirus KNV1]|uniref:Uncharacterized protein n=1 Tax=Klosneuvirus KNV1 TaxID=1977640 RepID=A0A1V0SLD8_9VIRU|nr:hypothetical protein Klosneuvirus_6_43 [Klosneuvirus KNV1]
MTMDLSANPHFYNYLHKIKIFKKETPEEDSDD